MKFTSSKFNLAIALLSLGLLSSACSDNAAEDNETAQQVGDTMASMDEMGGSSGSLALMNFGTNSSFAQMNESRFSRTLEALNLVPSVAAASCVLANTFGTCSSGSLTRTFGDCTIGRASFSGTVAFEFSSSTCSMSAVSATVKRSPNFTVTGKSGGTLAVSKTGTNGQMLTKTADGVFSFSNDGIRRVITHSSSTVVYDFTTTTLSAATLTGAARSGRVLSDGVFRILNNLNSVTCDIVPSSITWGSTCNCATSGTWAGTCSDGKTIALQITGCGSANLTLNTQTTAVSFDRCYGI